MLIILHFANLALQLYIVLVKEMLHKISMPKIRDFGGQRHRIY